MENKHINENNKFLIKCEDIQAEHPHCEHGPTLFFYNAKTGYYACAAHRDKRSCSFHLPADDVTTKKLKRRYEVPVQQYRVVRQKILKSSDKTHLRHYCHSCNVPFLNGDMHAHTGHDLTRKLNNAQLQDPTQFLRPLENDKVQAQYFFDEKALKFFANCFSDLGISKVVCMGAPRLHAYLRSHCAAVKSFLLDFDQRFFYFYDDKHYALYNMCNNHFFDAQQQEKFQAFLRCRNDEQLLIFTDPPFGCRTEPIAHTLQELSRQYNEVNELPHQPLPIFWIFPYFAERYIQQQMPALQMCDYKVNYANHISYTDNGEKCRKLGSPVRIFTNVPLVRIRLPVSEEYKYCAICERYTALENRHCNKCGICPSKNGSTYRHCERCGMCVKPTYVHCANCRRCTQLEGHNCGVYVAKQCCWICKQRGHTERKCELWRIHCKKHAFPIRECDIDHTQITCLLCGCNGHNERCCPQRQIYVEELTFMDETQLRFKV